MPPVEFSHAITLDGQSLRAARTDGGPRAISQGYVPLVQGGRQASPQLDPAVQVTWHRGSGASRRMVPGMIDWGENVWTCDPGVILPGPRVTTVALPAVTGTEIPVQGFAEQGGDLYVLSGRYVTRIPNGSDAPATDQDLGVGVVAYAIKGFATSLFVSGTEKVWEKPVGSGWTGAVSGASSVVRGAMGTVFWDVGGAASERLVAQVGLIGAGGLDGVEGMAVKYVSADPRDDADWTPNPGYIRISRYTITNFVSTRDHIYIATTGGLHDLDASGAAPNLTPEVEHMVLSNNGRAVLAAGGWVYMGAGYGLLRVRVSGLDYAFTQWCTPGLNTARRMPVSGLPMAITRYGQWIILAQYDAQNDVSYVSWGREAEEGEVGPMAWNCSPIVLDGLKVTALHVSGLVAGAPRLWMAVTDGTTPSLRWAPLAVDSPLQDLEHGRPYTFASSFAAYLTGEDWTDDATTKDLDDLVMQARNLGAGTSIAVSTKVDASATYTSAGTLASGPRAVLTPATTVRGNVVHVRLAGTGLPSQPPIVEKVSLRGSPRPDMRKLKRYQVLVGRMVRAGNGVLSPQDWTDMEALFERWQEGAPISMTDEDGRALTVRVQPPVMFQEVDAAHEGRVLAATLEIAVLKTVSLVAAYDTGHPYDGERGYA